MAPLCAISLDNCIESSYIIDMIERFYITSSDASSFRKFVTQYNLCGEDDYKMFITEKHPVIARQTRVGIKVEYSDAVILFRDKTTCNHIEMYWMMLRDEFRRNPAGMTT